MSTRSKDSALKRPRSPKWNRTGCTYVCTILTSREIRLTQDFFDLAVRAVQRNQPAGRGATVSLAVAARVYKRRCRRIELSDQVRITVRVADTHAHSGVCLCVAVGVEKRASVTGLPGTRPRIDIIPNPFDADLAGDIIRARERVQVRLGWRVVGPLIVCDISEELVLIENRTETGLRTPDGVTLLLRLSTGASPQFARINATEKLNPATRALRMRRTELDMESLRVFLTRPVRDLAGSPAARLSLQETVALRTGLATGVPLRKDICKGTFMNCDRTL